MTSTGLASLQRHLKSVRHQPLEWISGAAVVIGAFIVSSARRR
jgi:hypothetical protein